MPHPWHRYWARNLDYMLCAAVLGFTTAMLYPEWLIKHGPGGEWLLILLVPLLWTFNEAWMLSTCGTTPGKWLVGITITDHQYKRLTFGCSLKRSFSVWLLGFGLGIPLVSFCCLVCGYMNLKREQSTLWDHHAGSLVVHGNVGKVRIVGAAILYFLIAFVSKAL